MGLWDKFRKGLRKTREEGITAQMDQVIESYEEITDDLYEELEEVLIMGDVGFPTAEKVIKSLKSKVENDRITSVKQVRETMKDIVSGVVWGGSYLRLRTKPSVILVIGVNGVGKTTTTANIGAGLSRLGKKVLVIDTDLGLRNLDVVMGLENRIVYNLVDVVNGSCRLKQALIKDKRHPELYLLPSAQTKDKTAVSPEQMIKLTDDLREEFDYILLDCPAGIEQGFKNAIAGADRAIIVTTPEVSAIRDADRIIGLLEAEELKKIELVINRIRMDMVKRGDMMSVEDVVDILAIDLIGVVPDDESIVIATNEGEPLVGSDTQAGRAFANICHRVLGEEVPIMEFETEGILKKIANLFKRGY